MSGRPVWLASVARRASNGGIIPALEWSTMTTRKMVARLRAVLAGVGDPARERCFRMCITLCMHRALSDTEIAMLSPEWHAAPAVDVAGGPIEVIYTRGIVDVPSVRPCERLVMRELNGRFDYRGRPLTIPDECGECEPCRAREACHEAACAAL